MKKNTICITVKHTQPTISATPANYFNGRDMEQAVGGVVL